MKKKIGIGKPLFNHSVKLKYIFVSTPSLSKKVWNVGSQNTFYSRNTGIASNIFCDFAMFFSFFFLPPSLVSFLSPSVLQFCFCFKSQNSEIRGKKFTGGTIASVSQSKTLIHFELGLWQISIIHISKSTLISHSRPDLGGPEHN